MAEQGNTVLERLIQKFQTDILERIVAEISNGRLLEEGRVRSQFRTELTKFLSTNLDDINQSKLLIHVGKQLYDAHELSLAREVFEMALFRLKSSPDTLQITQYNVEATHGVIKCDYGEIIRNPKFYIAPMSTTKVLECITRVRSCLDTLLDLSNSDREKLAWLILNSVKLIYSFGHPLIWMECGKYVAESLIYGSLAMDSVINLCTSRHLPFKMKVCSGAFSALLTYANTQECEASVSYIRKKVEELRAREELDPPLTTATSRALMQAEVDISIMETTLAFWRDTDSLNLGSLVSPHD